MYSNFFFDCARALFFAGESGIASWVLTGAVSEVFVSSTGAAALVVPSLAPGVGSVVGAGRSVDVESLFIAWRWTHWQGESRVPDSVRWEASHCLVDGWSGWRYSGSEKVGAVRLRDGVE